MRWYYLIGVVLSAALAGAIVFKIATQQQPEPEPVPVVEAEPAEPEPAPEPVRPAPTPPTFDVVRVEPDGYAVLAGRAMPGARVVLLANGDALFEALADTRGEWTMVIEAPLDQGTQRLTLVQRLDDGAEMPSEQEVVVAVPERPGSRPLVVLAGKDMPSRVLQAPGEGVGQGSLVIESVDYNEVADVMLSGRAEPNATLRVYLNNQLIGETESDENGRWTLEPGDIIAPGRYTLRVDEMKESGQVARRVEMPFERASPEDLVFAEGRVVVQPGNNLWRIASFVYGSGFRYTVIYEANRNEIRNPDLIYPGQIFNVPGAPAQDEQAEAAVREG